jgi:hypothetical protein
MILAFVNPYAALLNGRDPRNVMTASIDDLNAIAP